jgi:hypothetical protein
MIRIIVCLLVVLLADLSARQKPNAQKPARNPRLFAPRDLGRSNHDREAWQKPDQVMDALHIGEGRSPTLARAAVGLTRLARRVGPNGSIRC